MESHQQVYSQSSSSLESSNNSSEPKPIQNSEEESKDQTHEDRVSEEAQSEESATDIACREIDIKDGDFGCKHYLRKCQLQCPDEICKGKYWTCRICHDDEMYENMQDPKRNHQLDRFKVTHVKCLKCDCEQPKSKACIRCEEEFAMYYCEVCSFYDEKAMQKGVFHCDKCNVCRVGHREKTWHCDTCGCCLRVEMKNNHKCVNKRLMQECPICLGDLQNSRLGVVFLLCGHSLHGPCYDTYINNNIACPLCRKSICDPLKFEKFFDQQFAETPMPVDYRDKVTTIQCNDCLKKSNVSFHIFGGKCFSCRSYNTSRIPDEIFEQEANAEQNALTEQTQNDNHQ